MFNATHARLATVNAAKYRSQSSAQDKHTVSPPVIVGPCSENLISPAKSGLLRSTAEDVATGALPQYEYLATAVSSHVPSRETIPGKFYILASNGPTCAGYRAVNVPIHLLIQTAFNTYGDKIIGAPRWVDDNKFDVTIDFSPATIDALNRLDTTAKLRAQQAALAPFLADRFHLTTHRETKKHPVYALVVAKKGPKLHESTQPNTPATGLTVESDGGGGYVLTARGVRIDTLRGQLQKVLEHTVVDRTGLTGLYDFTLSYQRAPQVFTSSAQADAANFSVAGFFKQPVFEAVDKQLGLKLKPSNAPVEVIVIDHIEKPAKD